jgi:glutamate-ammonia-ligase adenylyltransferase
VAQILQLQHGFEVRELRTTATLPALVAARSQGLISELDETTLETAWTKASQLRAAVVLATGKLSGIQGDVLPQNTRDLAGLAAVLAGMPDHSQELPEQKTTGQQIAEDYLRAARRARKVFERLVYKQS